MYYTYLYRKLIIWHLEECPSYVERFILCPQSEVLYDNLTTKSKLVMQSVVY